MSFIEIGDNELIYLIRSSNYDAKDYFVKRYTKRIYGMINSFLQERCIYGLDYEDYFQECFIVFLKCLENYDEEYNFYSYFNFCLKKKLGKIVKRENINSKIIPIDNLYISESDCVYNSVVRDSENIYEHRQINQLLEENFDEISKMIIKYRMDGYSYLEIAGILNVDKKYVYRKVEKIKSILKRIYL